MYYIIFVLKMTVEKYVRHVSVMCTSLSVIVVCNFIPKMYVQKLLLHTMVSIVDKNNRLE
jgi:hypothetical protein